MMELTKDNFDSEVTKANVPVLVDFWAPWCGPCRVMSPMIEELAGEMPEVMFAKVNVDDHSELAMRFNILSIPTFVVMKGGSEIARFSGAMPKDVFVAKLKAAISG